MKRKASAEWKGSLKEGKGNISTESGVLDKTQYSFSTRFENGIGTNPEELVAAAHAACFSMQLSALLGKADLVPDQIATTAVVTFENLKQGWTVTESHLEVTASIPGATQDSFAKLADEAKSGCLMSRLLNTTVTMVAKLVA
ncbi:MAG TPA: OsmC family peroxiredoxin [Geobacter sp.]|nr:OsmC family peroxiredoxin [Geobacter sp.]HCE67551.1 OsmC family peroxiredoxin [Geobacter sp.]